MVVYTTLRYNATYSWFSFLQTYRLPLSNIFCETARGLAGALRYSDIRVLLECANKSSFASDSLNDEILMAAIKVLASHSKEVLKSYLLD